MNKRYLQILFLLAIISVITAMNCVSAIDNNDANITSSDVFEVHISPEGRMI